MAVLQKITADAANDFLFWICQIPENHWIAHDCGAFHLFETLARRLNLQQVNELRTRDLIIVRASGIDACSVSLSRPANLIMLFPDLLLPNSLQSGRSVTILAHELGHILNDHANRRISTEDAQFEADAFAAALGYKQELCSLLAIEPGEEARKRLARLKAA